MQLPTEERERNKLVAYLRARKGDDGFTTLVAWLQSELKKRDEENRVRGFENQLTEAQALAFLLNTIAACQMPEADRDNDQSGIGRSSAAILP